MKKIVWCGALGVLLAAAVATALSTGCTSARLKFAGRLMLCRTYAYAAGLRRNRSPQPDLADCDAAFDRRWQVALASYGDCPAVDHDAVLSTIRTCVDEIVNLIVGRQKVIFASSRLFVPSYPDFTYPEGADVRCQELANAVADLQGRQFKALICGASPDFASGVPLGIRDRFSSSPGGYVDPVGAAIAHSLDDLLDGTISNPIMIDENKTAIVLGQGSEFAWTGCQTSGAPATPDLLCQLGSYSWTAGGPGVAGGKGRLLDTTGGTFIDYGLPDSCNSPFHLICVEQ